MERLRFMLEGSDFGTISGTKARYSTSEIPFGDMSTAVNCWDLHGGFSVYRLV